MKKYIMLSLVLMANSFVSGQLVKEKTVNIGLNWPVASVAVDYTSQFSAKGVGYFVEYKQSFSNWLDLLSYAAYVKTIPDTRDWAEEDYFSTQNAFMIGNKARIELPKPYVAPYFEFGFGASLGKFETNSPTVQLKKRGITPHFTYSFGLDILGIKKHGLQESCDISLVISHHYVLKQRTTALVLVRFPIFYRTKNTPKLKK